MASLQRLRYGRFVAPSMQALRCRAVTSGGGYPAPDLARLGTADFADLFIGDVYDYDAQGSAVGLGDARHRVQAVEPIPHFRDYGGQRQFSGRISTVQCFDNNLLVRAALSEPGNGRILVVDTVASSRAALIGDNLAGLAVTNGWTGILLNGFLRDAACLHTFSLGIKALGTYPIKSGKRNWGARDVPVKFNGVTFTPGAFLYSDEDGILVADADLHVLAAVQASKA